MALRWRPWDRVVRGLPWLRPTFRQIDSYAPRWLAQNAAALDEAGGGRLWVVLGDSAAQGIRAPSYDRGYVGIVRDRLPGGPWRVLNLSRSGARTRDLLDSQLPELAALGRRPDLVSAVAGGNDLTHTPLAQWEADLRALLAALPAGTLVGTVPQGWREAKARAGNAVIRAEAARHGLVVADVWAHTAPRRGLYAADGFHPSEAGHRQWAAALLAAAADDLEAERDRR